MTRLPPASGSLASLVLLHAPLTTWLCRRLLGDNAISLTGAELLLEWGAARWLTDQAPRDRETAAWAARYDISLIHRVPAASFSPPPSADAAYVSIRPR